MSDDSNGPPPSPALSWLSQSLGHLNERKMVQWTIAYVALAYSIQHGVVLTGEAFEWPQLVSRITMLLFILGLPLAVTIAWYHGDRGRQHVSGTELTIISLLMVIGAALFLVFVQPAEEEKSADQGKIAAVLPAHQPKGVEAAPAPPTDADAVAIAVLPFGNLSDDREQEFFSDGMTEEISTVLTKDRGLLVIARASSGEYKGEKKKDVQGIGTALGVRYLIDGTVRKAGNRLRITAQLIRTDNGVSIWADSYDRQLIDVFAIQEEIAQAIAAALRTPLGLAPGQTLVSLRPKDEETYELFLRGRAAYRARRLEEAIGFLDQAVARDPNFAPSWRILFQARSIDGLNRRSRGEEPKTYPESGETLARRVIALAPGSPDGYAMLANLALVEGKRLEAMDLRKQALARDPDDPEVLNGQANDLWELGYLKEALAVRERQHLLEPLIPVYNSLRAQTMAANGMLDAAVRDWLAVRTNVTAGSMLVWNAYAQLGRFDDAINILVLSRGGSSGPGRAQPLPQAQVDAAVQVLRAAANKTAPPVRLPEFEGDLAFIYAYTNTPERVLDQLKKAPFGMRYVWWPTPSSVRKTERFKVLVREAGYVDVWRVRGWPDLCHPTGANDFACE